jgi:hypothetical protein
LEEIVARKEIHHQFQYLEIKEGGLAIMKNASSHFGDLR